MPGSVPSLTPRLCFSYRHQFYSDCVTACAQDVGYVPWWKACTTQQSDLIALFHIPGRQNRQQPKDGIQLFYCHLIPRLCHCTPSLIRAIRQTIRTN
jgi:hypothetical protein